MEKLSDEVRFFELATRRGILKGMIEKHEEETKNKGLMFFAKAMDPDAEKHHVGILVLLKRWIQEIETETESMEFDVMEGAFKEHLNNMKTNEG